MLLRIGQPAGTPDPLCPHRRGEPPLTMSKSSHLIAGLLRRTLRRLGLRDRPACLAQQAYRSAACRPAHVEDEPEQDLRAGIRFATDPLGRAGPGGLSARRVRAPATPSRSATRENGTRDIARGWGSPAAPSPATTFTSTRPSSAPRALGPDLSNVGNLERLARRNRLQGRHAEARRSAMPPGTTPISTRPRSLRSARSTRTTRAYRYLFEEQKISAASARSMR